MYTETTVSAQQRPGLLRFIILSYVFLSVCSLLFIYILSCFLSVCLYTYPSTYLNPIYVRICLSVCPSLIYQSIYPSVYRPTHPPIYLSNPWNCAFMSRGEAFMLTVLARLTLCKTKNEKSSVLISWFSGTPYIGTQIKCIVSHVQLARRC
jgi:hypothetical protein